MNNVYSEDILKLRKKMNNVYSEDKKETLKIIRPSVNLQSGSLKGKESNASHVDVYKSKLAKLVK